VGFVVDNVTMEHVFLRVLRFSLSAPFHQFSISPKKLFILIFFKVSGRTAGAATGHSRLLCDDV
jgi:hypothetical protein